MMAPANVLLASATNLTFEVTERALWKLRLREDINEIISGNIINDAKKELPEIETCINYASFIIAGGINNTEEVNKWINEAQNAASCLEDQIAMYRICVSNVWKLVDMKSFIGKSSIKELISRIKDCIKSKPYEVQESKFVEQLREITPFIRYSQSFEKAEISVFEMDKTIKELKELLRESCNRSVIFIIGKKGSGKTTLMKSLYEDNRAKSSFGPCSWVDDTSKITDLAVLLKKVLKGSIEAEDDAINELEIMNKIQVTFDAECKGRYLIVLDDVEDTCALTTLKHVLRGCKGKIICLTTRNNIHEDVHDDMKKDSAILMIKPLEANDAQRLLMHAAFPGFDGNEFKEGIEWRAKEKLGDNDLHVTDVVKKSNILDQVLEKCSGNPWNIRAVGRLFAAHPCKRWEEIQERIDGVLIDGNSGIGKLDPPILLEVEDPKLFLGGGIWQTSFLYCLAFPEGWEISAQMLVRLWMVEGIVQDSPLHSQEHEADSLLQELIKRNLLVVKKKGFDGKVLKCSVNKHIYPLALEMCKLQKFCRFVPDDKAHPASLPDSPASRYRVLAVNGDRGVKEVLDSEMLGKDIRLRSLLHFGTGKMQLEEFKLSFKRRHRLRLPFGHNTYRLLRTLELQGACLHRLPLSIGCLICLRYLGLRNTQLEDLPETFNRLTKLSCLDIRDTHMTSLDDMSAFTEMRHLHLAKSFRSRSVLISKGLRSMIHLRTLSGAVYGHKFEQGLFYLSFLRKLSIKKAPSASSKNLCAAVSNMRFLHSLAITTSEGEKFDISSLKIEKNVRKLKLGGDMGALSDDRLVMMHSLTYLYLWDSKLDVDVLLRLQGLQGLLLLSLCNASTCRKLSCTQGGYRKLKKLSIISMENLTECTFGTGSIKRIEELVFAKCDKLGSSPQGLEHILSLKHVYVAAMHPNFCESVKASAKVQPCEIKMPFHNSSRADTEARQTVAPEPIAQSATEGGVTQTKAVDPVSPRGAQHTTQDIKSGDGNTSAADSKAGPNKFMADAQKSYKYFNLPPSPTLASGNGKEIRPVQEDIEEYSDDENDSQIDTLGKTKAGAGYEAGQTSSMMKSRQDFEQAKEQSAQDQSSDAEATVPQSEESDIHEDDTAAKNAPTSSLPEPITINVHSQSKDGTNTKFSQDEVNGPVHSSDSTNNTISESSSSRSGDDKDIP